MDVIGFLRSGFEDQENRKRGQSLGLGMGLAFAVTAAIAAGQGRMERMETAAIASAVLLCLGLILPGALYPFAAAFEGLFKLVTKATMYVLLVVTFYLVFAPVGLVLRLLGKDPMDLRLKPEAASYWTDRKPNPPERAERQF
jgi:hypothetical protein